MACKYTTLDELAKHSYDPHTFSVLQLNCRSIKKYFENVKLLLNQLTKLPEVITLSETWINNSYTNKFYSLNDYTFISNPRMNKKRGR